MIYFLTLMLIVFLPGNIMLYATALMFAVPTIFLKMDVPQKLFVSFMVWSLIGCCFATSFLVSIYGCVFRSEGWLTWLILGRMAWGYWSKYDDLSALDPMLFFSMVLYLAFLSIFGDRYFPNIAIAGYSAMVFVILWATNYQTAIVTGIPLIIFSQNRSAIIASVSGVIVYAIFKKGLREIKIYSIAIVGLLAALCFLISPIRERILHINISSMGNGYRAQLGNQSVDLLKHLPITGFGMDNLCLHLKNPTGPNVQAHTVPDRTHNICLDIVLMTGWVGYGICLAILASCIWITVKHPNKINVACLSGLTAWIVFGFFNPQGLAAHALMLTCIFGFNRKDYV